MKVVYIGGHDAVDVPIDSTHDVTCERGKEVDLPDEIANGLLDQGWSVVRDANGPETRVPPVDPQWTEAKAKRMTKDGE